MTHRSTWKKREGKAAKRIGAARNIGSGSLGRPDRSSSDSTSEIIYLECKHRKKHSAVTLWDDTKAKAKKEGKTPVVYLTEHNRPSGWVLLKIEDVIEFAEHLKRVNGSVTSE